MRGKIAIAFTLAAARALPASANASFPGANGKIAFLKSGFDCLQLVNPDGTGQTQPGACSQQFADEATKPNAAISPDGQRVVMPVYNVTNDVHDLRNSKLDGTDGIVIPGQSYKLPLVGWSQDGKWISSLTYYTCAAYCGDLRVALADGTADRLVDPEAAPGVPVSWGRNGRMPSSAGVSYGFY